MENKTKRFLRLLLVIAMVAAILPMTFALATETGNVAKIGDTEYATLQAAMTEANKAAGNYTITLLKDSAEVFTLAQKSGVNITIDGDGHTFSGQITTSAGTLTIKNAKLVAAQTFVFVTSADLTIENCTLTSNQSASNYYGSRGIVNAKNAACDITVANCTISNLYYPVYFNQGGNSLTIENCDITDCVYLSSSQKCYTVNITNVNYTGMAGLLVRSAVNLTVNIENSSIDVTLNGQTPISVNTKEGSKTVTVNVNGDCFFTANGVPFEGDTWAPYSAGKGDVAVAEGAIANDPDDLVAQVDGDQYFSLQKAINAAAKAGKPVQLIADINLGSDIVVLEQDVTLDLNGHTISGTGTAVFQVGSTFTLVDSVGNGAIKHTGSKDSSTAISIANGNFIMESGSVISNHKAVQGGGSNKTNTITIKGGVINGTDAALNINKGSNTVSITGGKLVGGYAVHVAAGNGQVVTAFTVSGGEFTGALPEVTDVTNGKLSITGGTFTVDPSEYVAEGYAASEQNGIWSVVEFAPVAEINGTQYKSLQAAIDACVAGNNTIKLLTDINESVVIKQTEGVNITIEGDGRIYSGTIKVDGNGRPNGAETLTVQNVNFKNTSATAASYFINAESNAKGGNSEAHNLTVQNCTFESNNWHYAIASRNPYNLVVKNCTAKNVYYLIYNPQGGNGITVENVTVTGATYGIGAQKATNVSVKNYTYTGKAAGFYGRATSNTCVTILENVNITTTLDGQAAITLWKNDDGTTSKTYTFVFKGTNILTTPEGDDSFAYQSATNSPFVMKLADKDSTLKATEDLTITTDVADHKVAYNNGTYEVVPAAIEVIVTVQNATKVEGNPNPQFSYTTNVDVPALDITYTVSGTTINATVAEMDGYEFTVVPGTLTVQKALVLVKSGGVDKYFVNLNEALQYAYSRPNAGVEVHILGNLTVTEPIVIRDDDSKKNNVEMRSNNLSKNFTITATGSAFIKMESGTLFIKSLNINAENDAFYVTGGTVELRAYTTAHLTNVTSANGNCVYIRGGTVNVYGANLTSNGEYPAIQGNGNYAGNVHIGIWRDNAPSKITAPNADMAIYWPQNGKLTIDTATITGKTALYVKSGTIVINGGTFNGTGAKVDFAHNSNGANATGDAVVIESCKDAAYETPSVTIKGGTFISTNAQGVAVYNCNENKPVTKFISGGIFSSMPAAEWCAEGMGPKYAENDMWTVGTGIVAVDGVYFDDWNVAKTYIKGSSTIVLYANVENSGSFSVGAANKTVTLDLNGHKFTTTTIGVDGHKTLHIIDSATGGSVVVTNYTALYPNGYLNVDSDVDFNSKIQFSYHSEATPSTGCLLIDGQKWIGRGHYQQADGIIGTTGGTVTIKNNFKDITFNSGKFILNAIADLADFAGTQNITVNADTTLDLNGNILTTDSIICFSELIDTAQDKTGGIKVSTENISLMHNKTYMPIYDSENGCFRFYKFNMVSLGVKELNEAGSAVKFGVAIRFDKVEAYGLLADGNNYSYLTLEFVLTLENMDVPTIAYEFAAEQFTTWAANAYTHYNSGKAGDRALVLTVGGLDKLDAGSKLTVAPTLTSEVTKFSVTSVVMEAPAVAPTTTNSTDPTNKDEETENGGNSESGAAGGDDNTGA